MNISLCTACKMLTKSYSTEGGKKLLERRKRFLLYLHVVVQQLVNNYSRRLLLPDVYQVRYLECKIV
jgi:hypothetical protein